MKIIHDVTNNCVYPDLRCDTGGIDITIRWKFDHLCPDKNPCTIEKFEQLLDFHCWKYESVTSIERIHKKSTLHMLKNNQRIFYRCGFYDIFDGTEWSGIRSGRTLTRENNNVTFLSIKDTNIDEISIDSFDEEHGILSRDSDLLEIYEEIK